MPPLHHPRLPALQLLLSWWMKQFDKLYHVTPQGNFLWAFIHQQIRTPGASMARTSWFVLNTIYSLCPLMCCLWHWPELNSNSFTFLQAQRCSTSLFTPLPPHGGLSSFHSKFTTQFKIKHVTWSKEDVTALRWDSSFCSMEWTEHGFPVCLLDKFWAS